MAYRQGGGGGGYGGYDGGETTEFFVPSDQVGRIIGKGGSRINELKEQSRANINIARESNGRGETQVTVSGSEEAREYAKQLIMEIVEQADSRGGGGGGGYRGGGGGGGYRGGGGYGGGGRGGYRGGDRY